MAHTWQEGTQRLQSAKHLDVEGKAFSNQTNLGFLAVTTEPSERATRHIVFCLSEYATAVPVRCVTCFPVVLCRSLLGRSLSGSVSCVCLVLTVDVVFQILLFLVLLYSSTVLEAQYQKFLLMSKHLQI